MVRIDETLREALKQAVESAGSQSAFARLTGLGKQHISKYLRGDIKRMEHDTCHRLSCNQLGMAGVSMPNMAMRTPSRSMMV